MTNTNEISQDTMLGINPDNPQKLRRGFAAMSPEKQREIASKGGKASHGGGRKPGSTNKKKTPAQN